MRYPLNVSIYRKRRALSRKSLEVIAEAALGKDTPKLSSQQKNIAVLLSGITRNRINAHNNIYKDILKDRKTYSNKWLKLKSTLEPEVLNNLLARMDKHESKSRSKGI